MEYTEGLFFKLSGSISVINFDSKIRYVVGSQVNVFLRVLQRRQPSLLFTINNKG